MMLRSQSAGAFIVTCLGIVCAATAALPNIQLGSCGYFHSTSNVYQLMDYAAKVALEEGFFDDVVRNRSFAVNISAVNTQCSSAVAASVSLPLLMGTGQEAGRIYSATEVSEPVVAISGCGCSGSTKMVSNLGNPYEVTIVSGAATSVELSDKSNYPFFARTVPPDNMQGVGLARLIAHFGWRRVVLAYPQQDYASDIATVFREEMAVHAPGVTLFREPLPYMPLRTPEESMAYNYAEVSAVARRIAQLKPQPRIFVLPANYRDVGPAIRAFAEHGLVGAESAWFLAESACSVSSLRYIADNQANFAATSSPNPIFAFTGTYDWSRIPELLRGMVCLRPITRGPRYYSTAWQYFWTNLSRSKLLAAGMPPEHYSEPSFFADMAMLESKIYNTLIFDAMTALFVAIGDLLEDGVEAVSIHGEVLRDAVYAARFEGLSGSIGFDERGDRSARYQIMNLQLQSHRRLQVSSDGNAELVLLGTYDGLSEVVTFEAPVLFGNGTEDIPLDRPLPCGVGEEYRGSKCVACEPGRRAEQVDSVCTECLPGYFAASRGASACTLAPAGAFVPASGLAEFAACAPGTFQQDVGATACQQCLPGSAQDRAGQVFCKACDIGTYAGHGATECTHCSGRLRTRHVGSNSSSACRCPAGSYADTEGTSPCLACPEGMFCDFGVSASGFQTNGGSNEHVPLLLPGHYTRPGEPTSVYLCRSLAACPGGLPDECAGGRVGLVCARCRDGEILASEGCTSCSSFDVALPVFALIALVGMSVGIYYLANAPITVNATGSQALTLVGSIGVTNAQVLGSFGALSTPWPRSVSTIFSKLKILNFDPDAVAAECLLGSSATQLYLLRVSVPFLLVGAVFGAMLVSRAAPAASNARWEFDKALNSVGTAFQLLFVALTTIAAAPFVCYLHPNEERSRSVQSFPDVLCFDGSSSHVSMVTGSMFLLSFVVIPFMATNIWASRIALRPINSGMLTVRFRYLFYRFRPDVWWWGNIYTLRQLLLAFAPLVSPDNPNVQVVYVAAVFMFYLALMCVTWPWKAHELNVLDAVSVCTMKMMVMAVGTRIPADSGSTWQNEFFIAAMGLLVGVGVGIFALALHVAIRRGPRAEFGYVIGHRGLQDAESTACDLKRLAALIKALPVDSCEEIIRRLNVYDRSALSVTMSSIQAASLNEGWISSRVAPRLVGIEHSVGWGDAKSQEAFERIQQTISRTLTTMGGRWSMTSSTELQGIADSEPCEALPRPFGMTCA